MNSELIFYTNPWSRGRIVRWMLEEVGAPYTTEILDYGTTMKTESYLKVNPMGKVPSIVHNGKVVTEVAAICAYLADAYPEKKLAPPTSDRHDYYRWLFFGAGPVEAAVANKSMGFEIPPDKEGRMGYGNMDRVVQTLKIAVTEREYIAYDHFTAADLYLGYQIGFGMKFKMIPELPELTDYWNRLTKREAYQRATRIDDELADSLKNS